MILSRPYPERIAELERKLEITRQQYMDADHALRIKDDECRRLRSEASELMAENANLILANDHLKIDKADLHERLERQGETFGKLLRIGREQGERIRELEGEGDRPPKTSCAPWDIDFVGQHDLPPTRAEALATYEALEQEYANRIATDANEEREG